MQSCWAYNPSDRPTFSTLVAAIGETLAESSDYLSFGPSPILSTFSTPLKSGPLLCELHGGEEEEEEEGVVMEGTVLSNVNVVSDDNDDDDGVGDRDVRHFALEREIDRSIGSDDVVVVAMGNGRGPPHRHDPEEEQGETKKSSGKNDLEEEEERKTSFS